MSLVPTGTWPAASQRHFNWRNKIGDEILAQARMLKEIHRRYPMTTVSLTKERPWARASGGESRVQGEESVIVVLSVSESREGPIEGHTLGRGA